MIKHALYPPFPPSAQGPPCFTTPMAAHHVVAVVSGTRVPAYHLPDPVRPSQEKSHRFPAEYLGKQEPRPQHDSPLPRPCSSQSRAHKQSSEAPVPTPPGNSLTLIHMPAGKEPQWPRRSEGKPIDEVKRVP